MKLTIEIPEILVNLDPAIYITTGIILYLLIGLCLARAYFIDKRDIDCPYTCPKTGQRMTRKLQDDGEGLYWQSFLMIFIWSIPVICWLLWLLLIKWFYLFIFPRSE